MTTERRKVEFTPSAPSPKFQALHFDYRINKIGSRVSPKSPKSENVSKTGISVPRVSKPTMNTDSNASSRSRRNGIPTPRFDNILERVGGDGKHQKQLLYCFLLPLAFYIPFGSSSLLLMLSSPDHHCRVPAREALNVSRSLWRKVTIPWTRDSGGRVRYSRCLMRNVTFEEDPETSLTHIALDPVTNTSCQYGWEYDKSAWDETATAHFNWVCEDEYLVTTMFSLAIAANAIGTLLFALLSDRYGRRPIFFVCVLMSSVFGLCNLYSPGWKVFSATKFLGSMPYFAMYQLPYIIVVEQSTPKTRGRVAALCAVFITLGMCCLSLVAWLTKHWKTFGLACYLPGFLFFAFWKFLPESPRWLLSNGRVAECSSVLHRIASTNGKTDPPDLIKVLCELKKEEIHLPGLIALIRIASLRKRIIIVALKTAILCIVYSGIVYNIRNMTGNEFINFFALSLVDIPGNLLGMVSARFLGRRLTTVYTQFIAAGFCFFASVATTNQLALTVLCSLGKLFMTSTVVVVFMQVGELFPTPLRCVAYGLTGALGLSATVVMPVLMSLGTLDPRLPYYILGALCLLGASISSLLPETLGRALPQTTAEANAIGYGRRFCACIHHWNVHQHGDSESVSGVDASCNETSKSFLSNGSTSNSCSVRA